MRIRWESMWKYRGNMGIGLDFAEGWYRIQFAANLDVEVSRRSSPCLQSATRLLFSVCHRPDVDSTP